MVGLDGGYVRNWDDRKTNFEVIVGQSVSEDRDTHYVGLHGYDRFALPSPAWEIRRQCAPRWPETASIVDAALI